MRRDDGPALHDEPDDDGGRGAIIGLYAMLSAVATLFVLGQTLEWPPVQTDHVHATHTTAHRM